MASKKNTETKAPVVSKSAAKEMRTQARKEANRRKNEAQHMANVARKAQGKPTVHEEKREKRALARKGKQEAFELRRDALLKAEEERNRRAEIAKGKEREALVKTLVRESRTLTSTTSAGINRHTGKPRRPVAPVTISHLAE